LENWYDIYILSNLNWI